MESKAFMFSFTRPKRLQAHKKKTLSISSIPFSHIHLICIALKHGHPRDHITGRHLVAHSQNIFHVPTFGIHINKASTQKDI
jgi:hypothetical protein